MGPIRMARLPCTTVGNSNGTTIIADCEMDYSKRKIDISYVNWFKKLGRVAHSYISYDPQVWTRVETLVLAEAGPDSGSRPKLEEPCPPS